MREEKSGKREAIRRKPAFVLSGYFLLIILYIVTK